MYCSYLWIDRAVYPFELSILSKTLKSIISTQILAYIMFLCFYYQFHYCFTQVRKDNRKSIYTLHVRTMHDFCRLVQLFFYSPLHYLYVSLSCISNFAQFLKHWCPRDTYVLLCENICLVCVCVCVCVCVWETESRQEQRNICCWL